MKIYWEKDIYLPLNNHNHKFLMSWKLDTSKTLTIIRKLIEKLQERSPLNDSIVHNYASRSPVEMVLNKEECPLKFKRLIQRLCEMKRISDVDADNSKLQYQEFSKSSNGEYKHYFWDYCKKNNRLDKFLGLYIERTRQICSIFEGTEKSKWKCCKSLRKKA